MHMSDFSPKKSERTFVPNLSKLTKTITIEFGCKFGKVNTGHLRFSAPTVTEEHHTKLSWPPYLFSASRRQLHFQTVATRPTTDMDLTAKLPMSSNNPSRTVTLVEDTNPESRLLQLNRHRQLLRPVFTSSS